MASSSRDGQRTLVRVDQDSFEIPGLRAPTSTLREAVYGDMVGIFLVPAYFSILVLVPILWVVLFNALSLFPADEGSRNGLKDFLVYFSGVVVGGVAFIAAMRWNESRAVNQGKVHIVVRNPAGGWGKRVVRVSPTDASRPLEEVFEGARKGVVVVSGLTKDEVDSMLNTLMPFLPED